MNEYKTLESAPYKSSDEETMQSIREILDEEQNSQPKPRKVKAAAKAFVTRTPNPAEAPRRRSTDLPDLQETSNAVQTPKLSTRGLGSLGRLGKRVSAYRPTPRHLAIASVLLLMLVRPHWFVIGAILALVLIVGTFLLFGADRIWQTLLWMLDRVERNDPARGARLRNRLDRFAVRWDAFLDMLPDGIADELYMPDFQDLNRDKVAELDQRVSERLYRMVNADA